MSNWRKVLSWQMPKSSLIIWDWKEQADPSDVNTAIQEGLHYFYNVPDTGGDNEAWVASAVPLDNEQQIQNIYNTLWGADFEDADEEENG